MDKIIIFATTIFQGEVKNIHYEQVDFKSEKACFEYMEKHNKLNDMFLALEKLNDEYDELEQMDREQTSSGAGDLTDQLVTMGKLISGLFQVLDRSSKIVPMESVNEAVDQALIDSVVDQIMRDIEMGDQTAIEELLMSVPEHNLRGFL